MRSVKHLSLWSCCALRSTATYGDVPLGHAEMANRYTGKTNGANKDILTLLEQTEDRIGRWKLNKWEFRVPPLLAPRDRENYLLKLDILKSLCIDQTKQASLVHTDLATVQSITGTSAEEIRQKNRQWLQEEASKLRWKGDINKAKALRDAFLRLEVYGAKEHRLLERLCCIYGMGMMGTFEDAFGNMIVEDVVTKKISVEEENSFKLLLSEIVDKFPQIDIIYDFLGFNPEGGYRESFKKFCVDLLQKKNKLKEHTPDGRVSFYNSASKEIFFDFNNSKAQIVSDDSVYGLPDFLYVQGSDMYLITIASENHWLRSRQVPHAKQLEGIARRGSFVLGIPYDSVRIRNVLLPPSYMDKSSLERVAEAVLGISGAEKKELIPWLSLYSKELDAQDVDYCDIQKTVNEEEWLTL